MFGLFGRTLKGKPSARCTASSGCSEGLARAAALLPICSDSRSVFHMQCMPGCQPPISRMQCIPGCQPTISSHLDLLGMLAGSAVPIFSGGRTALSHSCAVHEPRDLPNAVPLPSAGLAAAGWMAADPVVVLVVLLQGAMPTAQNLVVLLHLDGKACDPPPPPPLCSCQTSRLLHIVDCF